MRALFAILLLLGLSAPHFAAGQSGDMRILNAGQIQKLFTGNTLHILNPGNPDIQIWNYHPNKERMIFTATRMDGRQVSTDWRVEAGGVYCYQSPRFGERCFRVAALGKDLRLLGRGRSPDFRARLLKGNPKNFAFGPVPDGARGIEATHPGLTAAKLPDLIPAEKIYGERPSSWNYLVSPDGKKLAWYQIVGRKPTLHVKTLPDGSPVRLTHPMPITRFRWARDSRRLIFTYNLGR